MSWGDFPGCPVVCASNSGGADSIPGRGIKILHAMRCSQKTNKKMPHEATVITSFLTLALLPALLLCLHWVHPDNLEGSPHLQVNRFNHLNCPLSCDIIHSQGPGISTWTSLGGIILPTMPWKIKFCVGFPCHFFFLLCGIISHSFTHWGESCG